MSYLSQITNTAVAALQGASRLEAALLIAVSSLACDHADTVLAQPSAPAPVKCYVTRADCNGDPADGCEVKIWKDPSNCGACG